MRRSTKVNALKGNMCAAVAERGSLFAGSANVGFRFAINVWRKTCGD
jgi:hypothetical protein